MKRRINELLGSEWEQAYTMVGQREAVGRCFVFVL